MRRKCFNDPGHVHFLTLTCYRRQQAVGRIPKPGGSGMRNPTSSSEVNHLHIDFELSGFCVRFTHFGTRPTNLVHETYSSHEFPTAASCGATGPRLVGVSGKSFIRIWR